MKNTKYQKILAIAIIGILIYPSITLASWWNPFSWFKKTSKIEQPIVQVQTITPPIEVAKPKQGKPKEKVILDKKTSVKTVTPLNPTPPVKIATPQNPTAPAPIQLTISDITFTSTPNSASVSWKTNINSESKFILNGNVYQSKSGVDRYHYAEVTNLDSGQSYNGTITALANNAWDNKTFSFTTQQAPLKITNISHSCSTSSCTITWETNHLANSIITITKPISVVGVSQNGNSTNHTTLVNVQPATTYYYEITANSDTESVKVSGSFISQSPSPPPEVPCHGTCA